MNLVSNLTVLVVATLVLPGTGCIAVDGGAVGAAWDLRFADGRRVDQDGNLLDCGKEQLSRVQFSLISTSSGEDPCEGVDHCRFGCSQFGSGTTDFAIPQGQYAITLQLVDLGGQVLGPAEGIVAPGPRVRNLRNGEIADLDVNLIIVDRQLP